jgi:hypothetical protein
MKGLLQVGATLLLLAAGCLGAQKNNPKAAKAEPPPRTAPAPRNPAPAPAAKANGMRNPEEPKGGGAPRLGAPGNPVERLMAMPPEQRERVLEKLPASQQANLRQRLDRFDKLPPEERERLNQMFSTFHNLPPEKQAIVARQMQAFNNLPDDRRRVLAPVLQRLRRMPEDERNALLSSEMFKSKYSAADLQMLSDISQNYPLPTR